MTIRKMVICAIALLLILTSIANAAELGKGASEIAGSASLTTESLSGGGSSASTTSVSVDVLYGYCLSSNWEIAPGVSLTSVSGGGSTASNFGVSGQVFYNFSTSSSIVPFAKAGAGFGSLSGGGSSVSVTFLPIVGAGIRTLIGNSASINIGADYEHLSYSESGLSITSNAFVLKAGFSIFPAGFGAGTAKK